MKFESIYIQDNFVPDICSDQFRRKNIGVSVILQEGDTIEKAEQLAEEFIADYIKRNKIEPPKSGVVSVPFEEIAAIQPPKIDKKTAKEQQEQKLIDDINSCTELKVLESYRLIAKSNKKLQTTYDYRLKLIQDANN
jgi:hypothetical protein